MKKNIVYLLLLCLTLFATEKVVYVNDVTGSVLIKKKGDTAFSEIENKGAISQDCELLIREESILGISLGDKRTNMRVSENSKVSLEGIQDTDKSLQVNMPIGNAFFHVVSENIQYTFITPAARISSESKHSFTTRVNQRGGTDIFCNEGNLEVLIIRNNKKLDLSSGNSCTINTDGSFRENNIDEGEIDVDKNIPEILDQDRGSDATEYNDKLTGSAIIGATTVDGENYQRIGIRMDIPVGRFGFGVNVDVLLDADGDIRKEDWDEWEDYLNMIYYLRYNHRRDPFYFRIGGLEKVSMAYGIALDNYSNMIEYPDRRMLGMELALSYEDLRFELFFNDFKELNRDKPGALVAARANYKVLGDLSIGASIVSDLNEYNGLSDQDGDGFPDRIDKFPSDKKLVTMYEYQMKISNNDSSYVNKYFQYHGLKPVHREDLADLKKIRSRNTLYSFDINYPLLETSFLHLDLYSVWAKFVDYGWGVAAPGLLLKTGPFNIRCEYRYTKEQFIFGHFNHSYEINRSSFVEEGADSLVIVTAKDRIAEMTSLSGIFASLYFNFLDIINLKAGYQDLRGDHPLKSLQGGLSINPEWLPKLSKAELYYFQDNVKTFSEWKTESTVCGGIIGYQLSPGASINLDYRLSFRDRDGNGIISGDKETVKTISISTGVVF